MGFQGAVLNNPHQLAYLTVPSRKCPPQIEVAQDRPLVSRRGKALQTTLLEFFPNLESFTSENLLLCGRTMCFKVVLLLPLPP